MRFVTCVCASALSALFANSAQAQTAPTVTFSASPTSKPTLTVGETVAAIGTARSTQPRRRVRPRSAPSGPATRAWSSAVQRATGATWWEVAFNNGLTGWIYQSGVAAVSPTAPPVSFSANPASVPPGVSSTLSWSSTNATSCSGAGFSPSGVSGSLSVLPTATTVYSITCTGSGGSTTQSAEVVVNPYPTIGATVAATGTSARLRLPNSNAECVRDRLRGVRQPGRGHWRSSRAPARLRCGRSPSTTTLPGGLLRAVSRSHHQRRRHSRSARAPAASPPAPRRRCHGRRPTRLPAAEPASLHRASRDLSPSRRL